mmetsp:Transcript_22652/g.36765  ORF Transcript_22652/g.36765 Transcript_22652/m.36765 type:complete len:196 (+) Transcript_22652:197-784(+)
MTPKRSLQIMNMIMMIGIVGLGKCLMSSTDMMYRCGATSTVIGKASPCGTTLVLGRLACRPIQMLCHSGMSELSKIKMREDSSHRDHLRLVELLAQCIWVKQITRQTEKAHLVYQVFSLSYLCLSWLRVAHFLYHILFWVATKQSVVNPQIRNGNHSFQTWMNEGFSPPPRQYLIPNSLRLMVLHDVELFRSNEN